MQPLQISLETAKILSEKLKVPIEHLMHMPKHILLQKIAELAKEAPSDKETL
ncbi:MAG TPA: YycC family protein [Bacilli bacterium]